MYTIKQIADELGISKQAVHKRVQKLPSDIIHHGEHGEILIDEIGKMLLSGNNQPTIKKVDDMSVDDKIDCAAIEKPETAVEIEAKNETTDNRMLMRLVDSVERELELLHEQLARKDEQIAVLMDEIKKLTTTVDTVATTVKGAQALHANDIMKIEAADQATTATVKNELETESSVATKGWRLFHRKK